MLPSRLTPSTLAVFLALLTLAPLVSSTLAHDVAPVARREHLRMIRTFAAPPELPRRDVSSPGSVNASAPGSVNAASAPAPLGSDSSTTPAGTSAAATGKGTGTATTNSVAQTSAGTSTGAGAIATGTGAGTGAGTGTSTGAGTGTDTASPTGSGDTSGSDSGSGGLLGGLGGLLGSPSLPAVSVGSVPESTTPSASPSTTNGGSTADVGSIGTKAPQTSASTSSDSSSTQSTTQSASAANQSTAQPASPSSKLPKQTIIILVAIAASIVGAGLIWTVVRKWKFRPSSDFEGRLAPIDWQPSRSDEDMSQRRRPLSFTSHSSGAPASDHAGIRRDVFAPDFPPAHDFTALGGGYARGPSPQPPLAHGPSGSRGGYSARGY